MDILTFVYRNGVWIFSPVFALSVAALIFCIVRVVRVVRQAHIIGVPLLRRQEIEFAEAGRVVLCSEGPMFTRRFARLEYELVGPYGTPVKGRRALFRARTSGLSTVRMELKVYEIPNPGRYVLQIQGLVDEGSHDSRDRVVFMRPHLAQSMAWVLGIVFSSIGVIGSMVLLLLRLISGDVGP